MRFQAECRLLQQKGKKHVYEVEKHYFLFLSFLHAYVAVFWS